MTRYLVGIGRWGKRFCTRASPSDDGCEIFTSAAEPLASSASPRCDGSPRRRNTCRRRSRTSVVYRRRASLWSLVATLLPRQLLRGTRRRGHAAFGKRRASQRSLVATLLPRQLLRGAGRQGPAALGETVDGTGKMRATRPWGYGSNAACKCCGICCPSLGLATEVSLRLGRPHVTGMRGGPRRLH